MKKIIMLLVPVTMALMSHAQQNMEEVDHFKAAFGMEKKEIVSRFVKPDDAGKNAFWELYDDYETERMELGKKRIQLLEEYARTYASMTPEHAEFWTGEVIKLQESTDKLILTYYNKIKKANGPLVATQFYQIEYFILTAIRLKLLEGVPFLGEE